MSSVHTEALLSRYDGPGIECCGNVSGFLGLVGSIKGFFGTVVIVGLLPTYDGKPGLFVATGILDTSRGLFSAVVSMLRRGDLS